MHWPRMSHSSERAVDTRKTAKKKAWHGGIWELELGLILKRYFEQNETEPATDIQVRNPKFMNNARLGNTKQVIMEPAAK
jgi:hypothetical protein